MVSTHFHPRSRRCATFVQWESRTLLLSNRAAAEPRRAAHDGGMGIDDDLYTDILTSGEAVRRALQSPPDLWWTELGRRVFLLGPERDRPVIEGLDLINAPTPEAADFVLNTGPDDHRNPSEMAEFEPTLQECMRHRLKMICGKPRPRSDPRRRARALRRCSGGTLSRDGRRRSFVGQT